MDGAELLIADPFGLAQARIPLDRADQMLVYPRVYELEGLFTDGGTPGGDRGRSMLHRTAGYDLHSIREHQAGREPAPRALALDRAPPAADGEGAPGHAPRRGLRAARRRGGRARRRRRPTRRFDMQVRAAASLLRRMSDAGQRSSLVIHAAQRGRHRLGFGERRLGGRARRARGGRGRRPRARCADSSPRARRGPDPVDAARVFIVTAGMSAGPRRAACSRSRSAQCEPAVVWVDGATFAANGRTRDTGPEAAALRLTRSGIAVARDPRGRPRRPGALGARPAAGGGAWIAGRRIRVAPSSSRPAFLLFGGWHWARLEQPHIGCRELLVLALLAALPTVVAMLGGGRAARRCSRCSSPRSPRSARSRTPGRGRPGTGIYPARVAELVVQRPARLVRHAHADRRRPLRRRRPRPAAGLLRGRGRAHLADRAPRRGAAGDRRRLRPVRAPEHGAAAARRRLPRGPLPAARAADARRDLAAHAAGRWPATRRWSG